MKQLPIIWTGREKELSVEQSLTHREDGLELLAVLIGLPGTTLNLKTIVTHDAPATKSETLIHAILFGDAQINYDGLVGMPAGVPDSRGSLYVRALTIGDQARFNAVPRLEIVENQVSASHGVAVGRLDQKQLFYLRSRGLAAQQAVRLILEGFAGTILARLDDPGATRRVTRAIERGLRQIYDPSLSSQI